MTDDQIDEIANQIGYEVPSFGGGQTSEFNPLTNALKDKPLMFAAGVSIRDVVMRVLRLAEAKS